MYVELTVTEREGFEGFRRVYMSSHRSFLSTSRSGVRQGALDPFNKGARGAKSAASIRDTHDFGD